MEITMIDRQYAPLSEAIRRGGDLVPQTQNSFVRYDSSVGLTACALGGAYLYLDDAVKDVEKFLVASEEDDGSNEFYFTPVDNVSFGGDIEQHIVEYLDDRYGIEKKLIYLIDAENDGDLQRVKAMSEGMFAICHTAECTYVRTG